MDRMAKKLGEMRKGSSSLSGGGSPRYSVQKVDRKAKRSKNGLIYLLRKGPKEPRAVFTEHRGEVKVGYLQAPTTGRASCAEEHSAVSPPKP